MVSVAQLVEPRIVIPVVVGSSPIVHPTSADVVELVYTLDLGSSAERLESSSLSVRTISLLLNQINQVLNNTITP